MIISSRALPKTGDMEVPVSASGLLILTTEAENWKTVVENRISSNNKF